MEESKKKLKELEEWINAYDEPIERVAVSDMFYDLKDEIEYWRAMYDGYSKECEDIVRHKDREIKQLQFQIGELQSECTVLKSLNRTN